MKFSIITSTFNSEKTLKNTIESVLNQTIKNFEYVIIDGNSTDNTVNIIQSYEDEFQLNGIKYQWLSESDTGIYNAWNKALKRCDGDWVVFIGSDDYFKGPKTLETMLPYLNNAERNEINFVYGKIEHIKDDGRLVEISGKPWELQKERFSYIMNIGHSGSFHSKLLFKKNGNFNDTFQITGDYEFLLREFKNAENNALFVDEIVLVMREGGISANLKNRIKVVRESKKARKLNGITSFSKELTVWEIRVLVITFFYKVFGHSFATNLADLYRRILGKEKRWSN
ncbi:glycosyltransferase [Gelidibacter salicanalis]|uniref:Glycosyltransferase n=1 Tax=Gelidibacter salicanalis TaxID=291193 RepID=A0A5C7AJD9_9FLAO|nr:glycosyltransferase family 2 protein [Gelidibacter salicanalis]TXE08457.1 glycosyltransferase [Gelidibacter salicanalis]